MNLTDPDTLAKLGKLVLTDLVLAGDNAVVIALATRGLGTRERFWGRMIGAGGAVGLRVAFVAAVAWLLQIPLLQLVGGLVLLWIAWKLVRPEPEALHAAGEKVEANPEAAAAAAGVPAALKRKPRSLARAIGVIIMADITMSFDNVVAISNIAGDSLALVVFGLLLSIPLVVWGSVLISRLMEHFRWIIWLGGAVLGHVAGEIMFKDRRVLGWLGLAAPQNSEDLPLDQLLAGASTLVAIVVRSVPWVLAAGLFLAGWLLSRRNSPEPHPEPKGA